MSFARFFLLYSSKPYVQTLIISRRKLVPIGCQRQRILQVDLILQIVLGSRIFNAERIAASADPWISSEQIHQLSHAVSHL